MTELSVELPGNHLFIRSVNDAGVRVGDQLLTGAFIITPGQLVTSWGPRSFDDLRSEHLDSLLGLSPELVLIGTGARQQFMHPARLTAFYRAGVGVELMTTPAACRTFNVLVGEGRAVVAGLLPIAGSVA
jgi:uncharacterized protein